MTLLSACRRYELYQNTHIPSGDTWNNFWTCILISTSDWSMLHTPDQWGALFNPFLSKLLAIHLSVKGEVSVWPLGDRNASFSTRSHPSKVRTAPAKMTEMTIQMKVLWMRGSCQKIVSEKESCCTCPLAWRHLGDEGDHFLNCRRCRLTSVVHII